MPKIKPKLNLNIEILQEIYANQFFEGFKYFFPNWIIVDWHSIHFKSIDL